MEERKPVTFSIEDDGLIMLTFTGDLLESNLTAFSSDLSVASIAISHQSKRTNKKVKILIDMTKFSGKYTAQAITILADFAKDNTPYVERTASFGGSEAVQIAGETVAHMARRDNISLFKTKEEAMAWLYESHVEIDSE